MKKLARRAGAGACARPLPASPHPSRSKTILPLFAAPWVMSLVSALQSRTQSSPALPPWYRYLCQPPPEACGTAQPEVASFSAPPARAAPAFACSGRSAQLRANTWTAFSLWGNPCRLPSQTEFRLQALWLTPALFSEGGTLCRCICNPPARHQPCNNDRACRVTPKHPLTAPFRRPWRPPIHHRALWPYEIALYELHSAKPWLPDRGPRPERRAPC